MQIVKGLVYPKMKILSVFTHPHVVPNLYVFICSVEHKGRYLEECFNQTVTKFKVHRGDGRRQGVGEYWSSCVLLDKQAIIFPQHTSQYLSHNRTKLFPADSQLPLDSTQDQINSSSSAHELQSLSMMCPTGPLKSSPNANHWNYRQVFII